MSIRVVTSLEEFHALKAAWDEVVEANPVHTPFQTWEWNYAWWRHFGQTGQLRVLVVEADGQLIGIAPLFLRRRFRGVPLAHLAFLGHKRSDYLDFVVRAGSEERFFKELFPFLRQLTDRWRFAELRDIPGGSTSVPYLLQEAGKEFPVLSWEVGPCVGIPLSESFELFVKGLAKEFRKDVGYDRRYLGKRFQVEFKVYADASEMAEGFRDLACVYGSRWRSERGATKLEQSHTAAFERDICDTFSRRGMYRLYLLYANGKPAAGLSGYVWRNTLYADIFAHDPTFAKYSVGNVLLGLVIEEAIKHRWAELDLTRGNELYKLRWGGRLRHNYHVKIFRSRWAVVQSSVVEHLFEWTYSTQLFKQSLALFRRARCRRGVG